jgi:hypothetical protein
VKEVAVHRGVQIINLDGCPKAVRKFFESLGDEPVVMQHDGRAVYVIGPASALVSGSAPDRSRLAGEILADIAGTWRDIPDETLDAIATGDRGQAGSA